MATVQPRHAREELERLGEAIYRQQIEPQTQPEDQGKFVLIDVDSGDYEIDRDELAAEKRLQFRHGDAQVWMVRIGSRYARHIGPRPFSVP